MTHVVFHILRIGSPFSGTAGEECALLMDVPD